MRTDTFIAALGYIASTSTASLILLRTQRIVDDGANSFAQFAPLKSLFLLAIVFAAVHLLADLCIVRRQALQT